MAKPHVTTTHLHLRTFSVGYGGSGPALPPPDPDMWVVLVVDVTSSAKLRGLEVAEVALLDAAGHVVARAKSPWSVRRDLRGASRSEWDFGDQGTAAFDGEVEPGRSLRLRIHAPLDTRAASLKPAPVRYRARMRAANDPGAMVEGPLHGPWSTG